MPQAAPYTVASLAAYARSQEAGLENEPDWKLAHYVFQTNPELQQDTKLQSSQEIARTAFENAQPRGVGYFAATEGDKLKDFFINNLKSLESDELTRPQDPNPTWAKAAEPITNIVKGIGNAATAPYRVSQAKTPEDIQSALHDVLTQTLPTVAGARSVARAGIKALPTEAAGNSLMDLGAGIKNMEAIPPEIAKYIPGLRTVNRLASKTITGPVGTAVGKLGQRLTADIKPNTIPPAGANIQATPIRVPPPYTPQQDPFTPRTDTPAVETVEHSIPQTTTQTTTRSSGPIESASPVNGPKLPKTNNSIGRSSGSTTSVGPTQDPNKFSFKFQDLPRFKADLPEAPLTQPSGTFKAVTNGIPTDRINQLGGPSKLIDMANNVDAIKAAKGFDVMSEKVDPLVGGAFGRARLMASTEFGSQAQNVISELVKAYKQGNLPEILRRKDQLQILAKQARGITLPPPPPG